MRFSAASLQRRIVRRRNVTTARAVAAGRAGGLNSRCDITPMVCCSFGGHCTPYFYSGHQWFMFFINNAFETDFPRTCIIDGTLWVKKDSNHATVCCIAHKSMI